MKGTDKYIGFIALAVSLGALWYGYMAHRQNNKILLHTKELKEKLV